VKESGKHRFFRQRRTFFRQRRTYIFVIDELSMFTCRGERIYVYLPVSQTKDCRTEFERPAGKHRFFRQRRTYIDKDVRSSLSKDCRTWWQSMFTCRSLKLSKDCHPVRQSLDKDERTSLSIIYDSSTISTLSMFTCRSPPLM